MGGRGAHRCSFCGDAGRRGATTGAASSSSHKRERTQIFACKREACYEPLWSATGRVDFAAS